VLQHQAIRPGRRPAHARLLHPSVRQRLRGGKEAWRQLVAKFPDIRVVADDLLVDGDKVTVRSSVERTETLAFDAQPILIEVFRIEDGRLVEWWGSTWLPDVS